MRDKQSPPAPSPKARKALTSMLALIRERRAPTDGGPLDMDWFNTQRRAQDRRMRAKPVRNRRAPRRMLGPNDNLEIDHYNGTVTIRLDSEGRVLAWIGFSPKTARLLAKSLRRFATYAEVCGSAPRKRRKK